MNAPGGQAGAGRDGKDKKDEKADQSKKLEAAPPSHVGRKKKKLSSGKDTKLPTVAPTRKCRLRVLREERVKDYLLLEQEFISQQEELKSKEKEDDNEEDERTKVDELR